MADDGQRGLVVRGPDVVYMPKRRRGNYTEAVNVTHTTTVQDMTPLAAETAQRVAHSTYGVPAEQATAKAVGQSKHVTYRLIVGSVVVLVALAIAAVKLDGAPLAGALVGLVTVLGSAWGVTSYIDSKKQIAESGGNPPP